MKVSRNAWAAAYRRAGSSSCVGRRLNVRSGILLMRNNPLLITAALALVFGSAATWARSISTTPAPWSKLGVLRLKRLDPAHQRGDKLLDFGRNHHPTLESEIDLLVSKNRNPENNQAPDVTFRTHPALAVTVTQKKGKREKRRANG
jgi:hypothetical protein